MSTNITPLLGTSDPDSELRISYPYIMDGDDCVTGAEKIGKLGDLYNILESNDKNIVTRLFYNDTTKKYQFALNIEGKKVLPTVPRFSDLTGLGDSIDLTNSSTPDELKTFNEIYEQHMTQKSNTLQDTSLSYYYDSLVSIYNLMMEGNDSVVDVLTAYGPDYTGVINLNKYIGNNPGLVNCGIKYTDLDNNMVSQDFSFPLNSESFQTKLDLKVILEYTDGCLRIFPDSSKISECIISHCFISY